MDPLRRAERIDLRDFHSVPMRAFHMSWIAFFVSFVAWFSVAPLMPLIREDLSLTPEQVGNTVIASVAITVFARLVIGRLLDRYGPRRVYAWLLILGSVPVASIGLARSYESFLLLRMAIGAVGASFVITQFHTSRMFSPKIVGTANAMAAGWGNLGGGAAQILLPLLVSLIVAAGVDHAVGWRYAMIVPGLALLVMGVLYARLTVDTPLGNLEGPATDRAPASEGSFLRAARDPRVWALSAAYGACFGVEITLDNIAALYFFDRFGLSLTAAGAIVAGFGAMNLFARALGGWVSDRIGRQRGVAGRATVLGLLLLCEGFALVGFSQAASLHYAIPALIVVGLFVKMANGATYGVVPFVSRKSLGAVSGIVGAGGSAGAIAAGVLFRTAGASTEWAFLVLGASVVLISGLTAVVSLLAEDPAAERSKPSGAEVTA